MSSLDSTQRLFQEKDLSFPRMLPESRKQSSRISLRQGQVTCRAHSSCLINWSFVTDCVADGWLWEMWIQGVLVEAAGAVSIRQLP